MVGRNMCGHILLPVMLSRARRRRPVALLGLAGRMPFDARLNLLRPRGHVPYDFPNGVCGANLESSSCRVHVLQDRDDGIAMPWVPVDGAGELVDDSRGFSHGASHAMYVSRESSGTCTRDYVTSDHFDGKRFANPAGTAGQPFSKVPRMLLERRVRWPPHVEVRPQVPPPLNDSAAVITFIGHSTFLIQTAAANILTDPMYSERASPLPWVGPRRVRAPGVRFEDLPPISTVLLSHNHYDHCDLPTLRMLARRFNPAVVTPLGNGRLIRSAGIRQVEELDWWQSSTIAALPITLTPAYHFSARTPFDKNRALWSGFILQADGARIYFAGDTAFGDFFGEIRRRLGPIDLALLPIGAYEPRWFMKIVHMNPAEAVQAHLDLEAARSIAMHFGTFQLTTEGIDEPSRALDEACRARKVAQCSFRPLEVGESVRVERASNHPQSATERRSHRENT
jgi:L-ascorbate metabolism protein UlaG (beta-lactamase superfamily)